MELALSFSLPSLPVNCSLLNPVTTSRFLFLLRPRLFLKDCALKEYFCYTLDLAPFGFFPRLYTLLFSPGAAEERAGTSPAHHTDTGPRLPPGSLPPSFLSCSPPVPLAAPRTRSRRVPPGLPAAAPPPVKAVRISSARGSPGLGLPDTTAPGDKLPTAPARAPGGPGSGSLGSPAPPHTHTPPSQPRPPASRRQPPHREDRRPGTGRCGTARRGGGSAPARRAPSGPAGPAAAALSPCGAWGRREAPAPRPGPLLPGRLRAARRAVQPHEAGPQRRGGKGSGWRCGRWRGRCWGAAGEPGWQLRGGSEGAGVATEGSP